MVKLRYGNRDWFTRPLAILYAWTIGLVIEAIAITLGTIYAAIGITLRLLGAGSENDLPLWEPVRSTFSWWLALHSYAISGSGGPIVFVPPILDPEAV